MLSKTMNQKF